MDTCCISKVKNTEYSEARLGSKSTLKQQIHEITNMLIAALRATPLSQFSVDERLRGTVKRHTQKKEDKTYSLLNQKKSCRGSEDLRWSKRRHFPVAHKKSLESTTR
ncbi:hypothetical protein FOPE_10890 [Fonsecaea pedrosoi]|nr:hypothetical protein FOPE_10890 [Fonsecaea pedrosoi]